MGSKTRAREIMQEAGVPIVPGSTEPSPDVEAARKTAEEIGYPVACKAAGGGGGKGFRVAQTADDLAEAFEGAAREGEKFFSDDRVYLERYLEDPRHVEVQILADSHGNVIHLGERDCSIQRRHQKLIEEAPGRTSMTRCASGSGGSPRRLPARSTTAAPARSRACRSATSKQDRTGSAATATVPGFYQIKHAPAVHRTLIVIDGGRFVPSPAAAMTGRGP